ncbi:TonB-dependent receptor [Sphingomonas sp. BGYR3]|uniref:TonB-dependent receptor n=1 Tax=Sphingomonas sp. BGYR3 TaxID=2975483 RepID=UPI0021A7A3ED|nr:TonB-dependent receptor [Sphingomonas sp. BGYR3]MDG5487043.1 TonB-dependent receptor [Sphingomonas sp. BGYR3]
MKVSINARGPLGLSRLCLTSSALALALTAAPAMAQDAAPAADEATEQAETAEQDQSIVVVGFRASLQSAVSEKKDSDQIVESVTAEDIGKLPDNSIGESIARLPGVTSQRANGRANVIAIRGFGPDFSTTLLNGREQTSNGDNRGIEFDQFPAEVVNQVVIYKSPTANLIGQGLVGTVDVRTIRPLEYGKKVLAIGARGSYADLGKLNTGSSDLGYRVNGTFVHQFADDTLGISLAASYVDEPYQVQEFNAWGYFDPTGNGNQAPAGSKSFVTSTQLKRLGINGTIQYEPAPNWMVTVDGFYSKFKDEQIKRGIELPFSFFGTTFDPAGATAENGVWRTGTFRNVQGVIRNDRFDKESDLYSFGFNTKYEGDDGWNAFIDFGYSRTDRTELSFQSYAGTGYDWDDPNDPSDNFAAADRTDTIRFVNNGKGIFFTPTLNYADTNLIKLTDPLGWGGSRIQAGYYNDRRVEDELKQYRAEVGKTFEDAGFIAGVRAGLAYTDRTKSLTPDEAFLVLANGAREAPVPQSVVLEPTNLGYLGLGPVLSYDPRSLTESGVLRFDPNTSQDVLSKLYSVSEDLMSGYLQADLGHDFSGATLTGNLGVQAIWSEQKSTGFIYPPTGPVVTTLGTDYWDVLPSLNLSLRFESDFVVRFAASRQIMRPQLDDMRVAIGYGVNNDITPGRPIISGGGGNPYLRPYRANALDLNFEKYFGRSGFVALQLYYKDIVSYIDGGRFAFDYSAFPLPANAPPNLPTLGLLDTEINTGGGDFYGAEFAFTLPFEVITSALDGFGVTGGVGYTETKVENAQGAIDQIPGYSQWVANGTVFFEKWGINTRGSVRYRSGFLGDFGAFDGSIARKTALEELIVDAQVGYDFQSGPLNGLSVYVQGQNLTDEPFASVADPTRPATVTDYQTYGRRFLAGFTYRF